MRGFYRFICVSIILIIYFLYVCWKYGITQGIGVTLITWSFFIFGTPLADADAIVDFPIRVFTDIPMHITEIYLFIIAALISLWYYIYNRVIFQYTFLTKIVYKMITNPFSLYGFIVVLSLIGSVISAFFENAIYDLIIYKKTNLPIPLISFGIFIFSLVWIIYIWVLYKLNIFNQLFNDNIKE